MIPSGTRKIIILKERKGLAEKTQNLHKIIPAMTSAITVNGWRDHDHGDDEEQSKGQRRKGCGRTAIP